MKLSMIAVALATVAAVPAFAADLPRRSAPPPYLPPIPIFTWTGFYVGVNAGAAFSDNKNRYTPAGFATPITGYGYGNSSDTSFTGGGQLGYNWQMSQFVLGIEADINYLDRTNANRSFVAPVGTAYYSARASSDDNYFGTVRGRIGYAWDRFLVYGTGGLAYGGGLGKSTISTYNAAGVRTATYTNGNDDTDIGYALGGGVEYAFTNNWSVKAEYLYVNLGSQNRTYVATTGPAGTSFVGKRDNDFSVARVGLNYKF